MKLGKIINTENKISAGRPHRNSEGDPRFAMDKSEGAKP